MKWATFGLAAGSLWIAAVAQSSPAASAAAKEPLPVSLPFFAQDDHRNPVSAITATDFTILDNKRPAQSVLAVRPAREAPLRLGVLIDSSSSHRRSSLYDPGLQAAWDFMTQALAGPNDRVFVVSFNTVPETTDFMNKSDLLKFKMDVTPSGGTALFDSIYAACTKRIQPDPTRPARRVLVILSDGEDNQSHASQDEAVAAAQQSGTVIFTVSTSEDGPYLKRDGSLWLKQLAEETGGQSFLYLSRRDMPKVFSAIKQQVENMWLVTYVPAETGQAGKRRSIELKAASGGKLKLRAPKGYYVASPE